MANVYDPSLQALYGRDLWCGPTSNATLDLVDTMQEATGVTVLVQAVVRRQVTARGTSISSPNDGIDLRSYIKNGLTQQQLSVIAQTIQQELIRDQRVSPATTVTASYNSLTNVMTVTENIVPITGGSFSLTLAVSAVTVQILGLG